MNKKIIILFISLFLIIGVILMIIYLFRISLIWSGCDSVYFDNITVTDEYIKLEGGTYDSGLIVKKVIFEVESNRLLVFVYKGVMTEKVSQGLNAEYRTNMKQIDEVVLIGPKDTSKIIWTR